MPLMLFESGKDGANQKQWVCWHNESRIVSCITDNDYRLRIYIKGK
jgi:hypothetical protein